MIGDVFPLYIALHLKLFLFGLDKPVNVQHLVTFPVEECPLCYVLLSCRYHYLSSPLSQNSMFCFLHCNGWNVMSEAREYDFHKTYFVSSWVAYIKQSLLSATSMIMANNWLELWKVYKTWLIDKCSAQTSFLWSAIRKIGNLDLQSLDNSLLCQSFNIRTSTLHVNDTC